MSDAKVGNIFGPEKEVGEDCLILASYLLDSTRLSTLSL
jgi:hypothetical protein